MTYWIHSQPADMDVDGGQRPCARGEHCAASTVERGDDGAYHKTPALGPRVMCDRDRNHVRWCLDELPGHFRDLRKRLGEKQGSDGPKVAGRSAPTLPVREDREALMREILLVAHSWHERVCDIANLWCPNTAVSRFQRDERAMERICDVLSEHVDTLLSAQAEAIARYLPLRVVEDLLAAREDMTVVVCPDTGYAWVNRDLDGAWAGLELVRLDHRCRKMLGWTPQHENLPVPCWDCGLRTLRRYDGGAGLEDEAECTNPDCRTRYADDRFTRLMVDVSNARAARAKAS